MPIMMTMTWEGIRPADYDNLRKVVNWEGDQPAGGLFHVAAFTPEGVRITDVWESAEAFNQFVERRLQPGVAKVGLKGEPKVEVLPAHAVYAPGYLAL